MTNIKQNLYLPIFNALLISSLTALTACGGSGSSGNDISSVVSDSDGSDSSVSEPADGVDSGEDVTGGNASDSYADVDIDPNDGDGAEPFTGGTRAITDSVI